MIMSFLIFISKYILHILNPIFVYIVSLITIFVLTDFDTTNLVGTFIFSFFMMIPIYLIFMLLIAFIL